MVKPSLGHITVAIYMHPELYPPVLSAVDQLAMRSESITILTRRMLDSNWSYPENARVQYINETSYQGFAIEQIPLQKKIFHFLQFILQLKKLLKQENSQILMVHDVIPLFAAYIIRRFLKKRDIKLWYHNHDVTDIVKSGRFSLMGIATKFEIKAFPYIDVFTLPAKERLCYFPIDSLMNTPVILPNYPLKRFYIEVRQPRISNSTIKLVYQGSIGPGHGLETIITLLSTKIKGKQLELHLVGKIRPVYKDKLIKLVEQYQVADYFVDHGMQPFITLPHYLSQFDVGLAIHEPYNVTYATGGSASNKIYEYAACGLPVLLMDNVHYRSYLSACKWTFFTTLERESLISALENVLESYPKAQASARGDFQSAFNYETAFSEKFCTIEKYLLN
jgi:glycosyltransferase involved in cell wall biosynthesis